MKILNNISIPWYHKSSNVVPYIFLINTRRENQLFVVFGSLSFRYSTTVEEKSLIIQLTVNQFLVFRQKIKIVSSLGLSFPTYRLEYLAISSAALFSS